MEIKLIMVGNVNKGGKGQFGYTYSENGLSPTIAAGTHGYCIGHILVRINGTTDDRSIRQEQQSKVSDLQQE